jgi:hypothetical protein
VGKCFPSAGFAQFLPSGGASMYENSIAGHLAAEIRVKLVTENFRHLLIFPQV